MIRIPEDEFCKDMLIILYQLPESEVRSNLAIQGREPEDIDIIFDNLKFQYNKKIKDI